MKYKQYLNVVFILLTTIVLVVSPAICQYVDSFRARPGVAYGGELLLPLIPLLAFLAFKNMDIWKATKKKFIDNHKDDE